MGSIAARSGTWDEASSPAATRLARRFEDAWRASAPRRRPDPLQYLPDGPEGSAPAARLALLRADLNLRWDDGEAVRVESYRDRLPGLDAETLVALCYEEFCRREEDGEGPFAAEYDERFPELADRLRRVFDIHELVGNAASTDLHVPSPEAVPFPEAGQTIAGFHLVEELGRGSFARVFLARERQLADRPVALKVARTGSREPQTLARLQHTHIVPVHSYRDDPATGLHLLCMPYFGRVTLSGLLADPLARVAPTGAEILAALDRLDPDEARASSARNALARLPFGRAIAWWGARLAEALAHAHDRGILHRDIKPSNVLITGDALPMLLDFNLAVATRADEDDETLGGTLAYMAPEHLEAVARREEGRIDRRSDVYSLGVLLFEALTGERPFPPSSAGATSMPEVLRRAAEDRRVEPPRLRLTHPEVPAALERVIRRCLRPDPADRFRSAADLALDLQAVADDAPLRSTREPITVRLVRRGRRSWKKLALLVPAVAAAAALAMSAVRDGQERVKAEADASQMLRQGRASLRLENYADASARFEAVERLTVDRPELAGLRRQARVHAASAREAGRFREKADALARSAAELRPRLASPSPGPGDLAAFEAALAPFRILTDPAWSACVGVIYERYHTRDMAELGGLWNRLPLWAFFLILSAMGSAALPGLNGFVGEFPILLGMFQTNRAMAVWAALGMILGAYYLLLMIQKVVFGPLKEPTGHGHGHHEVHDAGQAHGGIRPVGWHEIAGLTPLMVLIVLIGVYPKPFLDRIQPPLRPIVAEFHKVKVEAVAKGGGGLGVRPGRGRDLVPREDFYHRRLMLQPSPSRSDRR